MIESSLKCFAFEDVLLAMLFSLFSMVSLILDLFVQLQYTLISMTLFKKRLSSSSLSEKTPDWW